MHKGAAAATTAHHERAAPHCRSDAVAAAATAATFQPPIVEMRNFFSVCLFPVWLCWQSWDWHDLDHHHHLSSFINDDEVYNSAADRCLPPSRTTQLIGGCRATPPCLHRTLRQHTNSEPTESLKIQRIKTITFDERPSLKRDAWVNAVFFLGKRQCWVRHISSKRGVRRRFWL